MKNWLFTVFSVFLCVLCFVTSAIATEQSNDSTKKVPLTQILNPDGTVDLDKNFKGSLDISGYCPVFDNGESTRFVEFIYEEIGPEPGNKNKYWDDLFDFSLPGADKPVKDILVTSGVQEIYLAGRLRFVCGVPVKGIAMWDGEEWSGLGEGIVTDVYTLAMKEGDLYAGGYFGMAGETLVNSLAKWNGIEWSDVGGAGAFSGPYPTIYDIHFHGDNMYVGGGFTTFAGVPANNIVMWDGADWTALSSGTLGTVYAIESIGDDIFVGGDFTHADDIEVNNIARWDGLAWHSMGSGTDDQVRDLEVKDGKLYMVGHFDSNNGTSSEKFAVWDGANWTRYDCSFHITSLKAAAFLGDDLYLVGMIRDNVTWEEFNAMRWDGSAFYRLGDGLDGFCYCVACGSDEVFIGGEFDSAGDLAVSKIAKWNGAEWSSVCGCLGMGLDNQIRCLRPFGNDVYAGGDFSTAGNLVVNKVTMWNGKQWSSLDSGTPHNMETLMVHGNTLYAGGNYSTIGGKDIDYFARWDGNEWWDVEPLIPFYLGMNIFCMVKHGEQIFMSYTADGGPGILHYNGVDWYELPTLQGNVYDMVYTSDTLYVGGAFLKTQNGIADHVAKWDGSEWSSLVDGVDGVVYAVAVKGDDIYFGGNFTAAGAVSAKGIARWDCEQWFPLANGIGGIVQDIVISGNRVYVGGNFGYAGNISGNISANNIACWNRDEWSTLGDGVDGDISTLAISANTLFAGGYFGTSGDKASVNFAQWMPRINYDNVIVTTDTITTVVGDSPYGFYKPALTIYASGGIGSNVVNDKRIKINGKEFIEFSLNQAPEIHVAGKRLNNVFTLAPGGTTFLSGAELRIEFGAEDATQYSGISYEDFVAVKITYPSDYPNSLTTAYVEKLSDAVPVPIRIENGEQIYSITIPVSQLPLGNDVAFGAAPKHYLSYGGLGWHFY